VGVLRLPTTFKHGQSWHDLSTLHTRWTSAVRAAEAATKAIRSHDLQAPAAERAELDRRAHDCRWLPKFAWPAAARAT